MSQATYPLSTQSHGAERRAASATKSAALPENYAFCYSTFALVIASYVAAILLTR